MSINHAALHQAQAARKEYRANTPITLYSIDGEDAVFIAAYLEAVKPTVSKERLEQMQAHVDAGGSLNCDQELLNHIQAIESAKQPARLSPNGHAMWCGWHLDQYNHECTCGYSKNSAQPSAEVDLDKIIVPEAQRLSLMPGYAPGSSNALSFEIKIGEAMQRVVKAAMQAVKGV